MHSIIIRGVYYVFNEHSLLPGVKICRTSYGSILKDISKFHYGFTYELMKSCGDIYRSDNIVDIIEELEKEYPR